MAFAIQHGFARVVRSDTTYGTPAPQKTPIDMIVATPPRHLPIRLSEKAATAELYKMAKGSVSTVYPVPVISRLSFGLAMKRPNTEEDETGKRASSARLGTTVHVALVIVGGASGGILVVALVAAIVYVVRRHCARSAEDEQRLLPATAEKLSPVCDNRPTFLAASDASSSTTYDKADSFRRVHVFASTVPRGSARTSVVRGSSCVAAAAPWRPVLRRHSVDSTNVTEQFTKTSTSTNGVDDIPPTTERRVSVIVPRGALGDNTSARVTVRTLDIPAVKPGSSASQMQLSPVIECSAAGIVELDRPIVLRIRCRTLAASVWRVGVLYRDVRCVAGRTLWMYADEAGDGCGNCVVQPRTGQWPHSAPQRYDQMFRQHRAHTKQSHQHNDLNDNQHSVLYMHDNEYVCIQTRHLTSFVCVAWPRFSEPNAAPSVMPATDHINVLTEK